MTEGFGPRTWYALALVAMAAGAAWGHARDASTVLLVLVLGTAAVLLAGSRTSLPQEAGTTGADDAVKPAQLIQAIDDPLLIVDDRRVVAANPAARRLLGQHILDQDVRVAIRHPAAAERLAIAGDDPRPVQLVGLGSRDQHWEMRIRDLGRGQRLLHIADRTDARAADRIRVDFVANASHELRTPLAAILGFVETLQDEAGDDPDVRRRFLTVMGREAQRMERLVEDLMSLSRIEAEKYRLPETSVDLATLAHQTCAVLTAGAPERGADIRLSTASALVVGDGVQLSQMLHNIVGNAMKYGRPATPILVDVGVGEDDAVTLTVSDESEGIAPQHLPRLTERFYRVDPGRSRAIGGTGLGLAIVKHIVERHRGRLEIASAQGRGTTIQVFLPPALS